MEIWNEQLSACRWTYSRARYPSKLFLSVSEWVGFGGSLPHTITSPLKEILLSVVGVFFTLSLSPYFFTVHIQIVKTPVCTSAHFEVLYWDFPSPPTHPAAVPVRVLMCWRGNRPFPDIFPYRQVYLMRKNTSKWFQFFFRSVPGLPGRNYWMSEVKPDTSHQMPMEHKKRRCWDVAADYMYIPLH